MLNVRSSKRKNNFGVKLISLSTAILFSLIALSMTSCTKKEESLQGKVDFDAKTQVVVIEMQNGGVIKLEMDPDQAPITVNNFVGLVKQKFYNGLKFHRVIKDFMIQGGDPQGTGMGGSSQTIKGEFSENGVNNNLKHVRGVISMARSQEMNSASSQFFIIHGDANSLDGKYAAFGKVIEGMDVVDAIANVECDITNPQSPFPLVPQIIKEMRIENK